MADRTAEEPGLISVNVRESSTAPGRLKVAFCAKLGERPAIQMSNEDGMVDLPEGTAHQAVVLTEFRLELN